jgi:hypothetical protein
MKNVPDKSCRENKITHFRFNIIFLENPAFYEITRENIVEASRPQMKTWHMHIACWIPKAKNTGFVME